jgi:hypothetical protein
MANTTGRMTAGLRGYTSQDGCKVFDLMGGRELGGVCRWGDIVAACDEIRRSWPTV